MRSALATLDEDTRRKRRARMRTPQPVQKAFRDFARPSAWDSTITVAPGPPSGPTYQGYLGGMVVDIPRGVGPPGPSTSAPVYMGNIVVRPSGSKMTRDPVVTADDLREMLRNLGRGGGSAALGGARVAAAGMELAGRGALGAARAATSDTMMKVYARLLEYVASTAASGAGVAFQTVLALAMRDMDDVEETTTEGDAGPSGVYDEAYSDEEDDAAYTPLTRFASGAGGRRGKAPERFGYDSDDEYGTGK